MGMQMRKRVSAKFEDEDDDDDGLEMRKWVSVQLSADNEVDIVSAVADDD